MSEQTKKVTTATLRALKKSGRKIVMLTAYDYPTAKLLSDSGVDVILLGDSLGNVILGYENTLPVTMEEMLHHAKAVRRGIANAMFIVDMPFMSYQTTARDALLNAARFIKEAGADAVKIEGDLYIDAVKAMADAGIPVMGHLGFTPQQVNQIGGYKVTGRERAEALRIAASAKKLQSAGVFSLVLEMVPSSLAKRITKALKVPVIGIGAGPFCDGQVLVVHDLVGLYPKPVPSFVKQYANLSKTFKEAVSSFMWDVHTGKFPDKEHSF